MLNCDRCGGPRINGATIAPDPDAPDSFNLDVTALGAPTHPESERWCRGCIRYGVGDTDEDPLEDNEKGETAEG